jgi:hypothetical protein
MGVHNFLKNSSRNSTTLGTRNNNTIMAPRSRQQPGWNLPAAMSADENLLCVAARYPLTIFSPSHQLVGGAAQAPHHSQSSFNQLTTSASQFSSSCLLDVPPSTHARRPSPSDLVVHLPSSRAHAAFAALNTCLTRVRHFATRKLTPNAPAVLSCTSLARRYVIRTLSAVIALSHVSPSDPS